jgi:hypothetical protein
MNPVILLLPYYFQTFGDVPSHEPPVSLSTSLKNFRANREKHEIILRKYLVLSRPFDNFAEGLELPR